MQRSLGVKQAQSVKTMKAKKVHTAVADTRATHEIQQSSSMLENNIPPSTVRNGGNKETWRQEGITAMCASHSQENTSMNELDKVFSRLWAVFTMVYKQEVCNQIIQ